jgi:hypothetical protein
MRTADYRDALRLVAAAIALIERRRVYRDGLRRRLRRLSLEADLLRARLRQAPVCLQRN